MGEAAEWSLHTIAAYAFFVGVGFLAVCALLWGRLHDGVLASLSLPIFLGASVILLVVSAAIWWATR